MIVEDNICDVMETSNLCEYIFIYILVFLTSCINFIQLEISFRTEINTILLKYVFLGILTIGFFDLFIIFIFRKIWLGNLICGIFFSFLALANYYVIKFRGMPVTVQDISNIRTAFNVIGAYSVDLSLRV